MIINRVDPPVIEEKTKSSCDSFHRIFEFRIVGGSFRLRFRSSPIFQQRTLIPILFLYMRVSSESWLDRNKMKFNFVSTFTLRRNNKKEKKKITISRSPSTRISSTLFYSKGNSKSLSFILGIKNKPSATTQHRTDRLLFLFALKGSPLMS